MKKHFVLLAAMAVLAATLKAPAGAQVAGKSGANDLVIAQNGATQAAIVVAPDAGTWEKRAAEDLQKYIEMMSGAKPILSDTDKFNIDVLRGINAVFVIGQAAIKAEPSLQVALDKVKRKNPTLRADAIVVRHKGNRVYLAGSNDESHYFAISWLLQQWGCRWYMPTEFGEAIPEQAVLKVGALDFAYAPPFEIRHYWLSWNGDTTGANEFRRRNFMTETSMVGMGHAIGQYSEELVPPGKTIFNISLSDPKTAAHIAGKIEADYAAGKSISLAIEDGNYVSDSPSDKALQVDWDKYMLKPSQTDAMMTLYNNVGKILREKYPNSKAKIGGQAYANVTLPPRIVKKIEPNVVMWIAPIDIDPIHSMDDPRSPPRQEYRDMMYRWARLMEGRLAIYDYDQGMLTWRDIPNPSHFTFAKDVQHYVKAGILGIGTESRGATGITFTNLFFRGQLMWNPNVNVDQLLAEFYPKFYGPAAKPMADYWNAIYAAWQNTDVTEHEYHIAPAIYTPGLLARLQKSLEAAEAIVKPLAGKINLSRNQKHYLERMKFTRLSFDILQNYMAMVAAAASENNYRQAVAFGEKALAAREILADMNGTFTTYRVQGEHGAAWLPGEVEQMKGFGALTDGTKGTLIAQTPLRWSFKKGAPLPAGWTYTGMEGGTPAESTPATQPPTPANGWSTMRTDIYLQGQGLLAPDGQSYTGHYWYQTTLDLNANQVADNTRMMFPGLFNEAWLYVNGELAAHRDYKEPWWLTDYTLQWDVDLTGKLKPGKNVIAMRGFNPHHFGGIFRRPFLYRANG